MNHFFFSSRIREYREKELKSHRFGQPTNGKKGTPNQIVSNTNNGKLMDIISNLINGIICDKLHINGIWCGVVWFDSIGRNFFPIRSLNY